MCLGTGKRFTTSRFFIKYVLYRLVVVNLFLPNTKHDPDHLQERQEKMDRRLIRVKINGSRLSVDLFISLSLKVVKETVRRKQFFMNFPSDGDSKLKEHEMESLVIAW